MYCCSQNGRYCWRTGSLPLTPGPGLHQQHGDTQCTHVDEGVCPVVGVRLAMRALHEVRRESTFVTNQVQRADDSAGIRQGSTDDSALSRWRLQQLRDALPHRRKRSVKHAVRISGSTCRIAHSASFAKPLSMRMLSNTASRTSITPSLVCACSQRVSRVASGCLSHLDHPLESIEEQQRRRHFARVVRQIGTGGHQQLQQC